MHFGKLRPHAPYFIFVFILSLLISLLFLRGRIDQDFYSFYYVGRGMADGMDMYRDFADNKGPVLYWFFSILNNLFGNEAHRALIISSTVIDAITVYVIFRLIEKWQLLVSLREVSKVIFFLGFSTIYYKSFSMGVFMGGFYSETLAFCLLILSIYLLETRKNFLSGSFFAFSVLTRPTTVFFLPVLLVLIVRNSQILKKFFLFLTGTVLGLGGTLGGYLLGGGRVEYLYHNLIVFNLAYAKTVSGYYWEQIITTVYFEARIAVSIILVLFVFVAYLKRKLIFRYDKWFILILFISSIASSFVGGLFYFHHFVQFSLIFLCCTSLLLKEHRKLILTMFVGISASCLLINYLGFAVSRREDSGQVNFIKDRVFQKQANKYFMVVPYYPEYYIKFDQSSPDRYYQSFYLSDYYSKNASQERLIHQRLDKQKLAKTTFVLIKNNAFDSVICQEYLENFGKIFQLKLVDQYQSSGSSVDVYVSEI